MRVGHVSGEIALAAVAVYAVLEASRMPLGTPGLPGPGLFPLLLAVPLCVMSAWVLARALAAPSRSLGSGRQVRHWRLAIVLLSLGGVALLFERLGFVVTMSLFLLIMFRAFGAISWTRAAVTAVLSAFVAYLFFHSLLGVPLPGIT